MLSFLYRAVLLLLFFGAGIALIGCDSRPKLYGVSGTVKYKGEPIKAGSISFQSSDGQASTGAPITDGKYEIPAKTGLPPGNYQVQIYYPDPKAKPVDPNEPPGETTVARDLLPAQYNTESKLTAEIEAESNEVNYDLK